MNKPIDIFRIERLIFLLLFIFFIKAEVFAQNRIKVLILSGRQNHKWELTTPAIKKMYIRSGRFDVDVTLSPDTIKQGDLSQVDVIVNNWNDYPENDQKWPKAAEDAINDFVKMGGGIVFFHASSTVFYHWSEFHQMAGGTWRDNVTRHGMPHTFEVKISDVDHPITRGVRNFWTNDELWVNTVKTGEAEEIATAFATAENGGADQDEPVVFCTPFGQGRGFYIVVGHNVQAIENLGFQTLMLRGTEWAAIDKVTIPIPDDLNEAHQIDSKYLRWVVKKNRLALVNKSTIGLKSKTNVWKFNFDKNEGKPYFHPLALVNGTPLTWLRPEDHPWHRGFWFSWKYINGLNYWEEDGETGLSMGLTEIKKVTYKKKGIFNKDISVRIHLEITYHPPNEKDLLLEKRTIEVSKINNEGEYYIDWESEFTALAPEIILDRTPIPGEEGGKSYGGYAGYSLRLSKNLLDVSFINDAGLSTDLHGKASKWINMQCKTITGQNVSMCILDHPQNFNHPAEWYITNDPEIPFYYFNPAPIFSNKLILTKDERIILKYRLLISPNVKSDIELNMKWKEYSNILK